VENNITDLIDMLIEHEEKESLYLLVVSLLSADNNITDEDIENNNIMIKEAIIALSKHTKTIPEVQGLIDGLQEYINSDIGRLGK